MKNISCTFVALGLLTLGCTACGTQWSGNYSGTWSGTANNTPITATTFNMSMYQQGSSVTGTWIATGSNITPISGQLTGTTSGNQLNSVQFIIPANETATQPTSGTYTGTGFTLNSNALSGTVTGTATNGGTLTATLNLTQSK